MLMRRILALMPSRRLLDRPCSTEATMPSKWARILRARLTNGLRRDRTAELHDYIRVRICSSKSAGLDDAG